MFVLLLVLPCLLACPDGGSGGFGDGDGPPPGDGDDDDDDLGDDLGPEGFVRGQVWDPSTGLLRVGVPVTEVDSEPPNAASTADDGFFLLEPVSWDPAQLWAGGEGWLEAGIALTEEVYLGIGTPIELPTWPRDEGIEWIDDIFGYDWVPETGAVIVVFDTPEESDAVGLSAALDAPAIGPYYFDADGEAVWGGSVPAGTDRTWAAWVGVGHGPATLEVTPNPGMVCEYPADFLAMGDLILWVPVFCTGG